MITVIRLGQTAELVAVTRCADLPDGLAVAAHPRMGVSFIVEGSVVRRLTPNGRTKDSDAAVSSWCLEEASGCQVIRLYDALRGDDDPELYRFTVRSIALERMLEVLEERYPAPNEVEALPRIKL